MKVIPLDRLTPTVRQLRASCHGGPRVVAPGGVMVHFDDSVSDNSGEGWFRDPDCKFGYNRYYLDNGDVVQLTPSMTEAAYHAGPCRTKNANSYYYGLAIAAKDGDTVTAKQLDTLIADILRILDFHQEWAPNAIARVVGHEEERPRSAAQRSDLTRSVGGNASGWIRIGDRDAPTIGRKAFELEQGVSRWRG